MSPEGADIADRPHMPSRRGRIVLKAFAPRDDRPSSNRSSACRATNLVDGLWNGRRAEKILHELCNSADRGAIREILRRRQGRITSVQSAWQRHPQAPRETQPDVCQGNWDTITSIRGHRRDGSALRKRGRTHRARRGRGCPTTSDDHAEPTPYDETRTLTARDTDGLARPADGGIPRLPAWRVQRTTTMRAVNPPRAASLLEGRPVRVPAAIEELHPVRSRPARRAFRHNRGKRHRGRVGLPIQAAHQGGTAVV